MADRDKRAISVRLSINSGRHSPNTEPPKGVLVYADAKVNWFFVEGAFVLQSIHKRDHAQLEKDFDLYLKRPGSRGEICLNPERDVTEYGIKKDDELEFRHKTLPISVSIDLHQGETRTVEVNSGYPVMDVVQAICGTVAIDHGLELSLALAKKNEDSSATQYQWLDSQSSLNAQGVKDGDTLLLRKKFFILNDDVEEAINGNSLLRDLLYYQIREMFLGDGFVGLTGVDKDKALAKVSCFLHHIEQKDESISDDLIANKVIPKCRQQDESFPSKLITVYFQERMVGLSEEEAKVKMLGLFLAPQSIAATYYPVKIEEIPDDYVLVCHSNGITQCSIEDGRLQPVDDREWRYINIRGANSTHKQKIVSVNALGSRHEFITSYSVQIASHITESLRLTKLKTEHKKQTPLPPTPVPTADTPTPTVPAPAVIAPLPAEYEYPAPDPLSPPPQAVVEPPPAQQEVETPLAQQVEPPPPQKEVDPPVQQQEVDQSEGVDPLAQQQEVGEEQAGVHLPLDPTEDQGPVEEPEEPPVRPPTPEPCSPEPPQTTVTLVGRKRTSSRPQEAPSEPTPPPSNPLPTIEVTPLPIPNIQIEEEVEENRGSSSLEQKPKPGEEEKEKIPLTPVTALSFSPTLYIPEYFGLDFRDVLRDYRLFHVVVMDRDKRSLLLNIKKPVREVVKVSCATFSIQDQQRQKFWLPKGKKNILQKYGGKPKKRVGKFLRKTASLPIAPKQELEADKSLEEQYDFEIKPYVIHLHYREPQGKGLLEETDLAVPGQDEVDMGQEWPLHETSDVRSYRQFYQSWCGAVQGAYPMTKVDATRLAALLTHVYYGDRSKYKSWPPQDYDVKAFLPEVYWKSLGVTSEVDKVYKRLSGKTAQECIIEASEFCSRKVTHQGVFYEVSVPGHDQMFHRKKMHSQLFGINDHGVFSVSKETGEVIFTHRFSDIYDWQYGENAFKLNFCQWSKDYNAYTYQREEILDTLQLYINMTRSGVISQAPSRPPSALVEDAFSVGEEEEKMEEKKMGHLGLARDANNSPQFSINISHSPESSPEPEPADSKGEPAATPDSVRGVVMSAV